MRDRKRFVAGSNASRVTVKPFHLGMVLNRRIFSLVGRGKNRVEMGLELI